MNKSCKNLVVNDKYLSGFELVQSKNIFYIITGSIIAGLGLLYDSYPVVLGSMLVSPMGGPIFRTISNMINNSQTDTLKSLTALVLLFIIGYIIGIFMSIINEYTGYLKSPTNEMISRTEIKRIITDVIIAFISGMVLAFSIYHKDLIVAVGIGLVISVLPPLVNGGLFHGIYFSKKIFNSGNSDFIKDNIGNVNKYLKMGDTSLILSMVNILCVFVSGYLMLKFFLC